MAATLDLEQFVGRTPDRLTLAEREAVVGKVIAMEIYSPQNLALQRIAAMADSVQECVAQLRRSGREPLDYEFTRMNPPMLSR